MTGTHMWRDKHFLGSQPPLERFFVYPSVIKRRTYRNGHTSGVFGRIYLILDSRGHKKSEKILKG